MSPYCPWRQSPAIVALSLILAGGGCTPDSTTGPGATGGADRGGGVTGGGAPGGGDTGGGATGGGDTGGGPTGGGDTGGGATGGGTADSGARGGGTSECGADAGLPPQFAWTFAPPLALVVGDADARIAASATAPPGDCPVPRCTPAYSVTPPGVATLTASGGVTVLRALDAGTAFVTADCAQDEHYDASTQLGQNVTIGTRWEVTTLAGTGVAGSESNDAGTLASFNLPQGVALDTVGNLYVADTNNNLIRRITPAGQVTTLAGTGEPGSDNSDAGTQATFNQPTGVALDSNNTIYVADTNNSLIRRITPAGQVTTLAGSGAQGNDNNDVGTLATFKSPYGVTVDGSRNAYVADTFNGLIRKITPGGQVTTLAGSGAFGYDDGVGTLASFALPTAVAVDVSSNVYVAGATAGPIRKVTPDGHVSSLAYAGLVSGVAVDSRGTVYATVNTNIIRKISAYGQVTTLAGSRIAGSVNDAGIQASFNNPTGVAVDSTGNIYVTDTGNHLIRKISPK